MTESGSTQTGEKLIPFPPVVGSGSPKTLEGAQAVEKSHTDRLSHNHRRTISGNILSKLQFLRNNSNTDKSSTLERNNHSEDGPPLRALAIVPQNDRIRKRKGSLRKTALLAKGALGRDRKGSDAKSRSPLSSPQSPKENAKDAAQVPDTDATPRPSQEDDNPVIATSPSEWTFPKSKASLSSIRSSLPSVEPASSRASITSPTLPNEHSTTDYEDQAFSYSKLPYVATRNPPSSSGDSYFQRQQPFFRRSTNRAKSPLASQPQSLTSSSIANDEEWDYSETAYWGYVILVITWLVFVVGVGSCFDVWLWAWDVGETPYAPPELNDDPTLPIVGYYPALMVLTCVMAWVWVVVAWVGMKYFRHADG